MKHRKHRQKKKSLQRTMSKDQCQTHPDQQESTTISENKDHQEQQESTTIIEKKDHLLKEGLGMPIIRATLRRLMSPSITVFLTMEDLEIISPKDGFMLKVEEISYDHESPDSKAQQHSVPDMESYHPLRVVNDPTLISKKDWIEESKVWNLHDDVIRSRLESEKGALSIHICGISGKGYGAILRDSQYVPIVARSKCLSDVDATMSTFYSRLNGVALGVKIALDYKLSRFAIYVPSFNLCNFMRGIWDRNGKGRRSNCIGIRQVISLLRLEAMCDIEKIYSLTKNIISDLDLFADLRW
ncbi:hypothetical protein MKW98_003406 [Papaver atlanticum]|uniref:Uncharacterized protein n=1 Tax=Papaver atlanticum TaxID=357466 RepID=A0AAD4XUR0_9MAGN|nr:hypothetical protein MKW98_003406 [Papaver atlanticum]